jgi:nicotinate-nucleotide adenylyltransferase
MKIGLYFGSFNPIHNGHLAITQFLYEKGLFNEIWMVVSPNNPLKNKEELWDEYARLDMVKLAINDLPFLRACDVEFSLPKPSYTIDTLHLLEKLEPNNKFSLILGEDNMENFHKWKNYEEILNRYAIYVYPRNTGITGKMVQHPNVHNIDAPLLPISATQIRALLHSKQPVEGYLSASVAEYLKKNLL